MNKSYYFAELATSYDAEIQDLQTDSEGKAALKARLKEKRQALPDLLPMIEFAPEMVVPVFYDAFTFPNPKALAAIVQREPDDDDFPDWASLAALITIQDWAQAHVASVLTESTGETFLITAACLEYLRQFDSPDRRSSDDEDEDKEDADQDSDDENKLDLAEAGDDWLGQQGFDSLKG